MTAEIAVMNKWAVALAADSKVTISGMGNLKTYDTVNKVFTLSKVHPVGIMIYGNAEFMEYPWETIIKLYRRQKGIAGEDYVKDWGKDFLVYLKKFGKIDTGHKEQNIKNIVGGWFGEIEAAATGAAPNLAISIGSKPYIALLKRMLDDKAAEIIKEPQFLTTAQQTAVLKRYAKIVAERVQAFFGSFADNDLTASAVQFAVAALVYSEMSPQCSGLVIAGFGTNEYFPTLVEYETDGYVGNSIKIRQKPTTDICRALPSCIRAFAQKEMVQRFMNGIESDFLDALFRGFGTILQKECLSVFETYGSRNKKNEANKKAVTDAIDTVMKNFGKSVGDYARENFWMPVVRMVGLLPKDELAHLAESLVALTSLKRRVSSEAETVGGPIDVALISKGDGFVWVKRKHYFPPDLNHQFARNYLKDFSIGGGENAKSVESRAPGRSGKTRSGAGAAGGGGRGSGGAGTAQQ